MTFYVDYFFLKRRLIAKGSGKKKLKRQLHNTKEPFTSQRKMLLKYTMVKLLQNHCHSFGNIQPDFALVYNF